MLFRSGGDYISWYRRDDGPPLDPHWLDLAVKIEHVGLVSAVGRPGHKGAEAFLQSEFDAAFKKGRDLAAAQQVLMVMARQRHPGAVDAFVAAFEREAGKANTYMYWYFHLIPELPKTALPRLEVLIGKLKGRDEDRLVAAIEELRNKKD